MTSHGATTTTPAARLHEVRGLSPAGLRGREDEWERVLGVLHPAGPLVSTLLVQGPPGSGKTRLLQETAQAARQRGFTVVTPHTSVGPTGRFDARLEEQAVAGPVLVALDDLHSADPAWLRLLEAPPPPSHHRFVWTLARACHAGGPRLDRLFSGTNGCIATITLGPLPDAAVSALVADLLGTRPPADLLALVSTAGGDPLLVVELVRGLREEGTLTVDRGEVRLLSTELPQRIHRTVHQRLDGLSPKSRHLLQVASVLGKTFAVRDVAEMLREATATLLPSLEEALWAGILVCNSERLAFTHEVVWRVVADSIPAAVRHALHREVGLMLVGRGDHGFSPVIPLNAGPVQPATADAPAEYQLLGPGQELGPGQDGADDPARFSRVVTAVDAHVASGHLASAAALARETLSQPLPALFAAELQCRLAHILIMGGQAFQAAVVAEQALAEPDLPDPVRENAAAARVLALSLHNPDQGRRQASAILGDGSRRPGDPAVVTAATVLSNLLWEAGDLAGSLRLARQAVAGIRSTTPATWRTHARLSLVRKLSNRRDFAAATAILQETQTEIDQLGLALHSAAPAIARARLLAQAGRLGEARIEAESALAVARELGAHLLVPLALSVLATVALRTGDLLTAADYVRRYRTDLPVDNTPLWSVQYDWVELLLAAEQDGPRRAAELLAGRHAGLATRRVLFIEEPGAAAWLVRLARAVGDPELATTAVRTADRLAAENAEFSTVVVAAVHARGLMEGDPAALARAAAEHLEPWAAGCAAEDLATLLGGGRGARADEAVSHLESALKGFEEIGAERDAARIRNQLRTLGVHRRRAGNGKNAASGWSSLSDMERTIAHLVNRGLTNRQIAKRVFLSPHTVNYHLRQIFRKLGIDSRVKLARLTQEHYSTRTESAAGALALSDDEIDMAAY